MEVVNQWLALILSAFGVLAGVGAMLRWAIGQIVARLGGRIGALEQKVDVMATVVDLRLKHVEADMALVKQHLLGTPAA